jgi:hypothetical protein
VDWNDRRPPSIVDLLHFDPDEELRRNQRDEYGNDQAAA